MFVRECGVRRLGLGALDRYAGRFLTLYGVLPRGWRTRTAEWWATPNVMAVLWLDPMIDPAISGSGDTDYGIEAQRLNFVRAGKAVP